MGLWLQDFYADYINKIELKTLTFIEAEERVVEIIPVMIEVMTEVEEILDKGHIMETEEGILHSGADPV